MLTIFNTWSAFSIFQYIKYFSPFDTFERENLNLIEAGRPCAAVVHAQSPWGTCGASAVHLRCICAASALRYAALAMRPRAPRALWVLHFELRRVKCFQSRTNFLHSKHHRKGQISKSKRGNFWKIDWNWFPKLSRLKHIGTIPACHTYQLQGFRKCSAAHRPWIVLNKFLHVSLNF